jgi:ribonuclease HI
MIAEEILWDEDVLRVFVDTSEIENQGIFGLGVCFVGQGEVIIKSKKYYNLSIRKQNQFAELIAIIFALEQLNTLLKQHSFIPSEVIVYSDLILIDKLSEPNKLTKNELINELIYQINEQRQYILSSYPNININIVSMKKSDKRYNPFYKAAHNAARKIIGK